MKTRKRSETKKKNKNIYYIYNTSYLIFNQYTTTTKMRYI